MKPCLKPSLRPAFMRAVTQPENPPDVLQAIYRERPDLLHEKPPVAARGGGYGHVFVFENEVVKAPVYQKFLHDAPSAIRRFDHEVLTQRLLSAAGLAVPAVYMVGAESCFYSMERLRGATLRSVFGAVAPRPAVYRQLAEDIAAFKVAVAAQTAADFPLETAPQSYVHPRYLQDIEQALYYTAIRRDLPARMPDLWDETLEYLLSYESRQAALVHGDLHGGNIILNADNTRIAGVVDFGHAARTLFHDDEFQHMSNAFDPSFVAAVQDAHDRIAGTVSPVSGVYCRYMLDGLARVMRCTDHCEDERVAALAAYVEGAATVYPYPDYRRYQKARVRNTGKIYIDSK